MTEYERLERLGEELHIEVVEHILPYWAAHAVDLEDGGFVGRLRRDNTRVDGEAKSAVLNARILWTFSAASRLVSPEYLPLAERAFEAVCGMLDPEHEGIFWSVRPDGRPADDRKFVYAQSFAIYGLAEYHRTTGDPAALERAVALYDLVEKHGRDSEYGGYFETFSRVWQRLEGARLSEKDAAEDKSMNTNLHVLEAYTTLYRVRPDEGLEARLRDLAEIFIQRIYEGSGHFGAFFSADWTPRSDVVSFGHDIEGAWLLLDAAEALADSDLRACARKVALEVARATLREGLDDDGGLLYEAGPIGLSDGDKHSWSQAEGIVGFVRAYQETGDVAFVDAAERLWQFIERFVVDREHGEWHLRLSRDRVPYEGDDKIGPWKCPYHSARACLVAVPGMNFRASDAGSPISSGVD